MESLQTIVRRLVAPPRGILAMDGSPPTLSKRFAVRGIEATPEMRRRYRELLLTTPDLAHFVSGIIFHEETLRQSLSDGTPFAEAAAAQGILVGLKVDQGLVESPFHPHEEVTRGLAGLPAMLREAKRRWGVQFVKWRAVFRIDATEGLPTEEDILYDTTELATYARLAWEEGVVPIVEPEVLMEGAHSLEESGRVHRRVWRELVHQLVAREVPPCTLVLKASMVVPGDAWAGPPPTAEEVGVATVSALTDTLPADWGGVVFLSGGQSPEEATAHLNAIVKACPPWPTTFSFARALHQPVLERWGGDDRRWREAQAVFRHRLCMAYRAAHGAYDPQCERAAEDARCVCIPS